MQRIGLKKDEKKDASKETKPQELDKFLHKQISCEWKQFFNVYEFGPIIHIKRTPVLTDICKVLDKNSIANVRFLVGRKMYKCNTMIVLKNCRCFDNILKPGMLIKLNTRKVTCNAFQRIYFWMTNNCCYCLTGDLLDMLIAAQSLMIKELVLALFKCLSQNVLYSELAAFKCYQMTQRKQMEAVSNLMLNRISNSFLIVVATKEYKVLNIDHVCQLLSSNFIGVHTEIEIFYAAFIWLYYDYEKREIYMRRLLSVIRFKLMPSNFIFNWASRLHELSKTLADMLCPILYSAMIYHQEVYLNCYRQHKHIPHPRLWIRDPQCPYSELLENGFAGDINFKMFATYLKKIQKYSQSFLRRIVHVKFEPKSSAKT